MTPVRIGWTGHALRALSLAAGLACTAGFVAWRTQPDLVHALDAEIRRAYEEPWLNRWNEALALQPSDPAAALARLDALGRDLGFVRELDRGAVLVRMVSQHAAALAEGLGSLDSARWHARRLHELDDRDLGALVLHCRLSAHDDAGRTEAIRLLRPVVQRFPGHGPTAHLLAVLLLSAGEPGEALAVLEAAADDPAPAQWDVRWGAHPEEQCWMLPVADGPTGLAASVTVEHGAPLAELAFTPPAGTTLQSLQVQVQDRAETLGPDAAQLAQATTVRVALPGPLPAGRTRFTVRATRAHALPDWLRAALQGDLGRALAATPALDPARRERLVRLQERCR
ncbi:MAG: hypothetical protein RL148_41 [Planctomycetota bacterium]|jgi:hypothetical protein